MLNKKIVLSDNDSLLAVLEDSFFRREGFAILPIRDEMSGLQAVEAEAPAMAVFDLEQMGERALVCCRAIKKDHLLNATPVLLVLPAEASEDLVDACWDAGCDAVVPRPLSASRFLDAACNLLGISRRLARRFPVSFRLNIQDTRQKQHEGFCVNLNAGGMFIKTDMLYPIDTRLLIEFTLPGFQVKLHCPVRVAWVNHPEWRKKNDLPCGLGVEFIREGSGIGAALQAFLDSLPTLD